MLCCYDKQIVSSYFKITNTNFLPKKLIYSIYYNNNMIYKIFTYYIDVEYNIEISHTM